MFTLAEEDFNNLVGRMTYSMDVSQFLFPASSGSRLMKKVAMASGMKIMNGLSNVDFHSSRPAWLWPPLSA